MCDWTVLARGGCPPTSEPPGHRAPAIYHEARLHGGHESQLAAIPHAELLQLPRTEPAGGGRKEEGEAPRRQAGTRKRRPRGRAVLCARWETESFLPHLFLAPRSRILSVGARSPPGPRSPTLAVQTPSLKGPQLKTGAPSVHLSKAHFNRPSPRMPHATLRATPGPPAWGSGALALGSPS